MELLSRGWNARVQSKSGTDDIVVEEYRSRAKEERLQLIQRLRRQFPLFNGEEIDWICTEFHLAVVDVAAEAPRMSLDLPSNPRPRQTVTDISDLRLDVVQSATISRLDVVKVEHVVRDKLGDKLQLEIKHDALQEILHDVTSRDQNGEHNASDLDASTSTPSQAGRLDISMFVEVIHAIREKTSSGSPKYFPFDPSHPLRQAWDIMMMMLLIYTSVMVPYQLAFNGDTPTHPNGYWSPWEAFDLALDVIFCTDVLVNFCTAVVIDGKVVTHPKKIAFAYLKSWLVIDVAGSFPFDKVATALIGSTAGSKLNGLVFVRVIKVIRLLKLLRAIRLLAVMNRLEEMNGGIMHLKKLLRMLKSFFLLLFFSHLFGCMFYLFVPDSEFRRADKNADTATGHEVNWLEAYDPELVSADSFTKYTVGLYWAVITISTMGYGDVLPVTHEERLFAIMVALIGACVFSFCMGNITSVIAQTTSVEVQYEDKLKQVSEYLEWRRVSDSLARRIKSHYVYSWRNCPSLYQEHEILHFLPLNLRREVLLEVSLRMLAKVPIFRGLEDDCLALLNVALKSARFEAGELIYKAEELGEEMFLIVNGVVTLVPYDNLNHDRVHFVDKDKNEEVRSGTAFGEMCLFPEICRYRTETATAESQTEVYLLHRHDLQRIAETFPEVSVKLHKLAHLKSAKLRVNNAVMEKQISSHHAPRKVKLDSHIQDVKASIRKQLEMTLESDHASFSAWKLRKFNEALAKRASVVVDDDAHPRTPSEWERYVMQGKITARKHWGRVPKNWRKRMFKMQDNGEIIFASERIPDVDIVSKPDYQPSLTSLGFIRPGSHCQVCQGSLFSGYRYAHSVLAFYAFASAEAQDDDSNKKLVLLAFESFEKLREVLAKIQQFSKGENPEVDINSDVGSRSPSAFGSSFRRLASVREAEYEMASPVKREDDQVEQDAQDDCNARGELILMRKEWGEDAAQQPCYVEFDHRQASGCAELASRRQSLNSPRRQSLNSPMCQSLTPPRRQSLTSAVWQHLGMLKDSQASSCKDHQDASRHVEHDDAAQRAAMFSPAQPYAVTSDSIGEGPAREARQMQRDLQAVNIKLDRLELLPKNVARLEQQVANMQDSMESVVMMLQRLCAAQRNMQGESVVVLPPLNAGGGSMLSLNGDNGSASVTSEQPPRGPPQGVPQTGTPAATSPLHGESGSEGEKSHEDNMVNETDFDHASKSQTGDAFDHAYKSQTGDKKSGHSSSDSTADHDRNSTGGSLTQEKHDTTNAFSRRGGMLMGVPTAGGMSIGVSTPLTARSRPTAHVHSGGSSPFIVFSSQFSKNTAALQLP